MLTTLAGLVLLAVFPCGCGGLNAKPGPSVDSLGCGVTSNPPMPRALIGPDVAVRVFCHGAAPVPIASVDELGSGFTRWSSTLTGDPAFRPGAVPVGTPVDGVSTFTTCKGDSPEVASADFIPPVNALPGSAFDAIATVHAIDGAFADGTVSLHGEVVAPVVMVDHASVDFGDVAPGDQATVNLEFKIENGTAASIKPTSAPGTSAQYFSFKEVPSSIMNIQIWRVSFQSVDPCDYSASIVWTATPASSS
jgi:hypothetical protein